MSCMWHLYSMFKIYVNGILIKPWDDSYCVFSREVDVDFNTKQFHQNSWHGILLRYPGFKYYAIKSGNVEMMYYLYRHNVIKWCQIYVNAELVQCRLHATLQTISWRYYRNGCDPQTESSWNASIAESHQASHSSVDIFQVPVI